MIIDSQHEITRRKVPVSLYLSYTHFHSREVENLISLFP